MTTGIEVDGHLPRGQRLAAMYGGIMLMVHLLALGGFTLAWSPPLVAVLVAGYSVRSIGITLGYHRYFAHRSFKARRWMSTGLAIAGTLACQGGVLWWVAHHRAHHRQADAKGDPHSPVTRSFWYAHLGWMVDPASFAVDREVVKDLREDRVCRFLQRHYLWFTLGQVVVCAMVGWALGELTPALGLGVREFVVAGFALPVVLFWHSTFAVNSVCHRWGAREFDTADNSRNNLLVALLTNGEGWHNNHHRFQSSAKHGLAWWQVDVTYYLLELLVLLGAASDVVCPGSKHARSAREHVAFKTIEKPPTSRL